MAETVSLDKPAALLRAGQLPAEATGFVGRKQELAGIARLLATARLVTVTGPGGVGKTRVALRAASAAKEGYPDGVYLTELSGLLHPELLPDAVAVTLGLPQQDARRQLDAVIDHLRTRQALLILDTCEHMVGACAIFAEAVLREAPDVTVLATSRQPLDAAGEHTFLVSPLPVPAADDAPGRDFTTVPAPRSLAGTGDALELFAQRAAAVVPGFTVGEANWPDAVRLCRRLDGVPLAIELAAVRLRALPLRELADRLERRFALLSGGRRGSVPRHQALRMAIEWSHGLCTPVEQVLWARLSVFAGSFGVAAVEQVCAGPDAPRAEVLDALVALVDKSVVLRDDSRYRMLDTVREFGAERLAASGDWETYAGRHLRLYLDMARHFGEHFLDEDQIDRFRELHREHANLRAAMEYGLTSGDGQLVRDAAELTTALYGYWHVSGMLREGRYWLGVALAKLPQAPSPERAWALLIRGYLATFGADLPQAVLDTSAGLQMARDLGDDGLLTARAYLYLQMALMFSNRHAEAFEAAAEARRRLEALGDRIGLLCLDAQVGHLHELAGQPAEAVEVCMRGLRRLTGSGESREQWIQSYFYLVAGCARFFQGGQEAECVAWVNRALRAKHALGDIVGCAYALEILAWLAADDGRHERTAWLLGGADPLWKQAGGRLGDNSIMEEFHKKAEKQAREGLGARYARLHADGATAPPDLVVSRALDDATQLRAPAGRVPAQGRPGGLTARELQIASLVAEGLSNREIADSLVISRRTVDAHVDHIYQKLSISSRVQLAVWLRQNAPA